MILCFSFSKDHRDGLGVGPDDDAHGLSLVELIQLDRKRDNHRAGGTSAGWNFRFRDHGLLRAFFQGGECLEIALKVNGGNSVDGGVASGGFTWPWMLCT